MALGRPLFARPRWRSVPASGKVEGQPEQRRVIERCVSARLGAGDQLGGQAAQQYRHPGLSSGVSDDPHVLVVQLQPKPGLEVAGNHRGAFAVEDGAPGQATLPNL